MKSRYVFFSFIAVLLVVAILAIPSAGMEWSSLSKTAAAFFSPQVIAVVHANSSPAKPSLWVSPAVPLKLRKTAQDWGIPITDVPIAGSARIDITSVEGFGTVWVYALVAPFPTVTDDVTFNELISSWKGSDAGPFAGLPLLMDESTLAAFTALWGPPSEGAVQTVAPDQLLDVAWGQRPSWAIVPFESLDPRWKVIAVDGQSPVRKDFELYRYHLMQASFDYPLAVNFAVTCSRPCSVAALPELPLSNRDPAKLTTVVMTGVTALVRATAFTMNVKGITYPGRDIRDWLVGADITHISNEVPFADDCPPPDPSQTKRLVFCSDPRYIELLTSIGTDVVELTGNHYADYGPQAMRLSLKLYEENGMAHYGGGADLDDARKPLLLENKGNKLAFIGCNSVDIGRLPTATSTRPGAAPCDYDYMTAQNTRAARSGIYCHRQLPILRRRP